MKPADDPLLNHLIVKLEKNEPLSPHEQRLTTQFLKRLRETGLPSPAVPQRPRTERMSVEQLIALDYAAQNARFRASAARKVVADAWSVILGKKVKTSAVTDAFTSHEAATKELLAKVISERGSQTAPAKGGNVDVTHDAALDAVSHELRNRYRAASIRSASPTSSQ